MNLSDESLDLCNRGPFETEALRAFLPALAPFIAEHGEREVVERCQIARGNCATDAFAVECVFAYYKKPPALRVISEMARTAMTSAEVQAVREEIGISALQGMRTDTVRVTKERPS